MTLRFKLPPGGDVPPAVAARRIGLSLEDFRAKLPFLTGRGFPAPDETTGNFDLDAIDSWRRARNPHLFPNQDASRIPQRLTQLATARNARDVVAERVARLKSG